MLLTASVKTESLEWNCFKAFLLSGIFTITTRFYLLKQKIYFDILLYQVNYIVYILYIISFCHLFPASTLHVLCEDLFEFSLQW